MRKGKQIIGMPVIGLDSGVKIGIVQDLIYNSAQDKIEGLLLEKGTWLRDGKIIPYSNVCSIGHDAVIVQRSNAVEKASRVSEIKEFYRQNEGMLNVPVMTESGTDLGVVDDILIDEASGEITGYEISGGIIHDLVEGRMKIPKSQFLFVGQDVIIISDRLKDRGKHYLDRDDISEGEIDSFPVEIDLGENDE
jgi:uncharacterized protein YrrD